MVNFIEKVHTHVNIIFFFHTKAIQEQQDTIKNQALKIEGLTAEAEQKDETLKAFDSRLKQIEIVLTQTHQ